MTGGRIDKIKIYESAAMRLGFEPRFHLVPTPADIDKAFAEVIAWNPQAITGGGWSVFPVRSRVAEFALRNGLPLATNDRSYVEAGGLLSYSPPASEITALSERFVEYLDRILRGTKPSELPVLLPSRYELVINMKTAKTLRLTIPPSVMQRADEVLQ